MRATPSRMVLACALLVAMGVRPAGAAEPSGPKTTEISYYYDCLRHLLARPIARQLDLGREVRRLTGNPRQAVNVDAHDQVRLPSTWWTPRLGFRPVSVDQMLRGPGPGTGPAPGKRVVVKAKTQGVTPGFFVKDSDGVAFLLKFDPPELSEMATGADVVGSYLYWAAGYNVADNVIYSFTADDLEIPSGTTIVDERGNRRPLDRAFLLRVLDHVPRGADGRHRAVASRLLSGRSLGPFQYTGRRRDDPEDLIPHQHRRELRGLWVMAAWTNHIDVRGPNSLDMWVTENGRSFVRHHLIDFGACFGSGSIIKREYLAGSEYFIDCKVIGRQLVTLGLRPFRWEAAVDPDLPSIGFIDSDTFDPGTWRPEYPNPAFDERTERDIRWGARIVAAFTDEHIRAAVARARYSDPRASEYLARVLIERRDKIVRRWLGAPATSASGR
jgi:hypothetical protein